MYNNWNTNEFGCTLYDIASCLLFNYTTTSNEKEIYICLKRYIKHDAPTYFKCVAFQSLTYMKTILFEYPFYMQLLSFWNIGLLKYWITYTKTKLGFQYIQFY